MASNLRNNHDLRTLILSNNKINSPVDLSPSAISKFIAQGLSLQVLECQNCELTDSFGVAFAMALKTNQGLTKFNFYNNKITHKTIRKLSIALKEGSSSLQEINLGKNNLSDKGGVVFG